MFWRREQVGLDLRNGGPRKDPGAAESQVRRWHSKIEHNGLATCSLGADLAQSVG